MTSVKGVLLGVAEIKLPLRRLPQNELIRIANLSHKAVLDPKSTEGNQSDHPVEQPDEQRKAIGVVDCFYAMDEVEVHLEDGQCQVKRRQDVVLKHKASDVIIITPVEKYENRVVYICRNDSYGRAAIVLQMMSIEQVERLQECFPKAVPQIFLGVIPRPEKYLKNSWSRSIGKKFTTMFTSLTTSAATNKSSKTGDRPSLAVVTDSPATERKGLPDRDGATNSESESEEETESSADDTDSQPAGKYYEDMGLDANAQEKLYDQVETASRSSTSSVEANLLAIEAEINYFVESDADFVRSLQSLEEDRKLLAADDTPQFIRENLTLLFMQVKPLIQLHNELHEKFRKSDMKIIPICQAIIEHQIDYESYVYFMENIPTVDRIIQTHIDYYKTSMPDLLEKLRKPRMRLHYYVLTLETVHKKTTSKKEKEKIQRAIEILKIPLKRADSKLFLGAVVGSPFDLSNSGNIIRHSDLQLRKGGDLPRRTYHVLALKTEIILTVSKVRSYQYITSFRMDQVSLVKEERGVMLNLQVRNGPRGTSVLHVFKAKNINVQQQWINDLKKILSEKVQTSTPRNSVIEGDWEHKLAGRRTKIRHGQSFDKTPKRLPSQNSYSDCEDTHTEQNNIGRSISDGSYNRRGVIKKNSSLSDRQKPIVRKQSGNSQLPESTFAYLKNVHWRPPLTIKSVFSQLEEKFDENKESEITNGTPKPHITTIHDHEEIYLKGLQEQMGYFLEEEFTKPPMLIINHMRNLYSFHERKFSVALKEACHNCIPEELASCFTDFAAEFIELYSGFLADRTRLDHQMEQMNLKNLYVLPVLHFELYTKSLIRLKAHAVQDVTLIEEALNVLQQCVRKASNILITEAVHGAPFDLSDCGPVLHEGFVKVRFPGMIMKQEMYMVLLNTMILLLECRPPLYHYVESIRMDTVGMGPNMDEFTFQLEVRTEATKTQTYSFRTPNKQDKAKWYQEITELLNKQVLLLKERLMKRLGNETGQMKIIESKAINLHCVDRERVPKLLETSL